MMVVPKKIIFLCKNKNFQIEKYFMLIVFALYCKEVKY